VCGFLKIEFTHSFSPIASPARKAGMGCLNKHVRKKERVPVQSCHNPFYGTMALPVKPWRCLLWFSGGASCPKDPLPNLKIFRHCQPDESWQREYK
jgi:hypothetical protein